MSQAPSQAPSQAMSQTPSHPPFAAVILAAGLGTRMRSDLPKVLHPLAGRPMLSMLLETVESLSPERITVVVGPDMEAVAETAAPHAVAVQRERLGTAHAVLAAREHLHGFPGDVLVLYGDSPLISAATMTRLLAARRAQPDTAVAVLGFRPHDPTPYGRLIMEGDSLRAIVETRDATPEQRRIALCNSGVMAISGRHALPLLERVGNDNAKGEYYLTDIVRLACEQGLRCVMEEGDAQELMGVNSRAELAAAEAVVQDRLRRAALDAGATMTDPATVYFSFDTRLGRDVSIGPFVVFGPGVTVGDHATIRGFCHFEGARIDDGAVIGPYARLRPGAEVGGNAHVGNFVEIKNARLDAGAKVNHLSYVGDATVGAGANVGAGTITCNYDGFDKHRTEIGAHAFIGSNAALVAPVRVGAGAMVGAGSVVTRDVADDALALTRAPHEEIDGWAARFRAAKAKKRKRKD